MKKTLKCVVVSLMLCAGFFIFAACTSEENSALFESIYFVNEVDFGHDGMFATLNWMFLRFHPDNVVERVDMVYDHRSVIGNPQFNFVKQYGVFSLEGRTLTITFSSDSPWIGIVHNDAESISVGNIGSGTFIPFDEFRQEQMGNSAAILALFNQ